MANYGPNSWYVNASMGQANASWTTSNSTITMLTSPPQTIPVATPVWDITTGKQIGTFSSWVSTTLTLQANASSASSGSTDVLGFEVAGSYYLVTPYANQAWTAGQLLRQTTTPTVGNERVFVVIVAGTSSGEPTWTVTKGAKNNFTGAGTAQECTGQPAVNGDDGTASGAHGTTSGATAAGSAVLTFSSVPAQVAVGQLIIDKTTAGVIPAKTTVSSFTSTTVTMSANAAGAGVGNGDTIAFSNTPQWIDQGASTAVSLGQIIQDKTGAHLFILSTAGNTGTSEPTWNTTTGNTTNDNAGGGTAVWTCIGATGAFGAWAAPMAHLASIFGNAGWAAAGNTVFVGDNHAETQAAGTTITTPAVGAAPVSVYCSDHTVVPPASANLKTTGIITTTGNNVISYNGAQAHIEGLTHQSGSGANSPFFAFQAGAGGFLSFKNCALQALGTSGGGLLFSNTNLGSQYLLENTTMQFANAGSGIVLRSGVNLKWKNTASAITGATLPTNLFVNNSPVAGTIVIEGVDLSALGSGKTIVPSLAGPGNIYFINCKFGASVTVAATPGDPGYVRTDVISSDSAATTYQQQRYWYEGTLLPETTIIRTGGASDGTTGISWNLATTATAYWVEPFESFLISIWNTATATNRVVTLYGTYKGTSLPLNDQIWIEAAYFGASGTPLASFGTETKANGLASGTALTADTASDWTSQASAYQTAHAYGAFTGIIKAGNATPQQIWFMSSHSGTGTSGSDATIFNGKSDGAQVTDNAGANQIVWQAFMRFSMAVTLSSPQPQLVGYLRATVKAALASTTFYVDPLINLS